MNMKKELKLVRLDRNVDIRLYVHVALRCYLFEHLSLGFVHGNTLLSTHMESRMPSILRGILLCQRVRVGVRE